MTELARWQLATAWDMLVISVFIAVLAMNPMGSSRPV
jgi:hypothetical protein